MSGKGIPNDLAQNTSIDVLPQNIVPETNAVVTQSKDNLLNSLDLVLILLKEIATPRKSAIIIFLSSSRYNYDTIFTNVVSSDGKTLIDAILCFKDTTIRLSQLL